VASETRQAKAKGKRHEQISTIQIKALQGKALDCATLYIAHKPMNQRTSSSWNCCSSVAVQQSLKVGPKAAQH
jgi:hypothetical protein